MVDQFAVGRVPADPVADRPLEFVERKGLGHPDSLCDGLAEAVSRALSQAYLDRVGRICHHNTDKVHLAAGRSEPAYGGGRVTQPIYVLLGGRATRTVDGTSIPVDELAVDAAREYLATTVPTLPADAVEVESRIGESSTDLRALFDGDAVLANDTSFGVGHAPLSPTERAVRSVESHVRETVDGVGQDVKVMGARGSEALSVAVAAAVVDRHVPDVEAYRDVVAAVRAAALERARDAVDLPVSVAVNAADDVDADVVYLTTTGLSAEMGDDGAVGRGNRVNGLITPHRSMSLEAAAGKNPVSHVGKLYNVGADRIARAVVDETDAGHAAVQLLSRIGRSVTDPWAVDVQTTGDPDEAMAVVERKLARISDLTDAFVRGEVATF